VLPPAIEEELPEPFAGPFREIGRAAAHGSDDSPEGVIGTLGDP
jgi:hypothetical protein